MRILAGQRRRGAGARPARLDSHPVTITIDDEHPGPVVPGDFAGLSFERGPLNPGNAGVAGYLFSPANDSLVTLFRNLGLGSLRVGGGSVDQLIPAGLGSDGFTGIDNLFAFADVVGEAAPGAALSGPDTGAYGTLTFTPDPGNGVSWTERFARDDRDSGRIADFTQHYYVGAGPGKTTARQAISNMLSPEWVNGTTVGTQPKRTTYTPYPWLYSNLLAPVADAGLRYRLTESNDYLVGVPGASNAFASALWALDYLHWWAAHAAAGVNFHNKQWLYTDTIVPDPGAAGAGYAVTPKGYGIKAFTLSSAGRVKPARIGNPDGINLTAYCVGGADEDYVTIINKTQGAEAADAAVTIVPPGPRLRGAQMMTLAGGEPGDATGASATLGGGAITGDAPWDGTWSALPADSDAGVSLTVRATTAAITRIRRAR